MGKRRLRNLLEQLHEELENADSVGPEARDLLRDVTGDIHDVLERTESASADEEESINDRLNHAIVEFKNSHPQLSFTIERIMKTLSDIGI